MTPITRRALLRTSALVPVAVVVACAGQTVPQALQQAAQDAALLATGLAPVIPQLTGFVSASTLATAQTALATLKGAATQLAGIPTTSGAVPVVQQIEQAVNAILGIAAPLLAATPAGPILTAASVLLPVIEAAVGMIVPPAASNMSPDQARLILAGAR